MIYYKQNIFDFSGIQQLPEHQKRSAILTLKHIKNKVFDKLVDMQFDTIKHIKPTSHKIVYQSERKLIAGNSVLRIIQK